MSLKDIRSGTIYAAVANSSQSEIVKGAMARLRAKGCDAKVVVFDGAARASGALEYLAERGWESPIGFDEMRVIAKPGDIVLTTMIAGQQKQRIFRDLIDQGVTVAIVVEGCRFLTDKHYIRDRWAPLIGWGPSIAATKVDDTRYVGCALFEEMPELRPSRPKIALINYKFTFSEARLDPDGDWARAAVSAATANGFRPLFSVHPASKPPPDGLAEISDEPFEDLLLRSSILISRSSSLVYYGLRWGVQPFFLEAPGEELAEFADPLGAYAKVTDAAALTDAIAGWASGAILFDPQRFFERHLDIQPGRPADLRLAVEVLRLRRDARRRARAGLLPTDVFGAAQTQPVGAVASVTSVIQ